MTQFARRAILQVSLFIRCWALNLYKLLVLLLALSIKGDRKSTR